MEAIIVTGSWQNCELASKPGRRDEDVSIRIWRFAAEGESSGVHEEESRVGKPIRKSET